MESMETSVAHHWPKTRVARAPMGSMGCSFHVLPAAKGRYALPEAVSLAKVATTRKTGGSGRGL